MSQQNESNSVLRTVGNWKQFFKGDKKQQMLFDMIVYENKWDANTRLSYDQIMDAMNVRSNTCLHDTDKCLKNTRRDL